MSKGISKLQREIVDCIGDMSKKRKGVREWILENGKYKTFIAVPVSGLLWEMAKRRNQIKEDLGHKSKRARDLQITVSFRHSFYRSLKLLSNRGIVKYHTSRENILLVTSRHDN